MGRYTAQGRNVSSSEPATEFRGHRNLAACFLAGAERYADYPALGVAGKKTIMTYRQMADMVKRFAFHLGPLTDRQTIGILSENRPEWGVAYLGILAAGGTVVPIDPLLKETELRRVFSEANLRSLYVSARFQGLAAAALAGCPCRMNVVLLDQLPSLDGTPLPLPLPEDSNRRAALLFTSGTTGKSKKVVLTHGNILSNIKGFSRYLTMDTGSRFLSVLPLHHTLECTCDFLAPMMLGGSIYYVREINSREILDGIRRHRITHFISVPLMFEKMYHGILNGVKKAPWPKRMLFKLLFGLVRAMYAAFGVNIGPTLFASFRKKAGLDSIQLMVSGGAPLPVTVCKNLNLLGFAFVEGYGLTETSPVISLNPAARNKFGSVGPPIDNVEVKIDDPDESGVGEILARGPMTTPGYEDNPEETNRLLRDGWLHTGDLGRLDDDGYLYIVGRKKNVIVSAAGKNIYPEEIESHLTGSPLIMEALVYGEKGPSGREEVAAVIYPDFERLELLTGRERATLGDDDIKAILDPEIKNLCSDLADFKRVKHTIYVRMELEKTSSRKIKRDKRT